MNQEIKAKWVAALRSGEYEQGTSHLNKDDKFCCLGVLCDIYRKETGEGEWQPTGDGYASQFKIQNDWESKVTPSIVAGWAGLVLKNPVPIEFRQSLAEMNDEGKTFAEIADIIEEHL